MNSCHRDVFDWIEDLSSLSTAEAAWTSFMDFCNARGFGIGALADMPGLEEGLSETVLCSNWPEGWLKRYIEADHLRTDPTVAAMMFTFEPYTWKEALRIADFGPRSQKVFDEASEFGMHDGFVVPIVGIKSGTAVVTLTGPASELSPRERATLHLAALYAHARVRELRPARRPALTSVLLSPREQQCLQWAAVGKSDWEIGKILSISASSVATYMKNVEQKFGVTTRMQAVVQALVRRAVFL